MRTASRAVASVSAQASKSFTVSLPRRSRTVPYPNALRSACVRDSLPSVPACLECFFVDPRAMVERARSSEANEREAKTAAAAAAGVYTFYSRRVFQVGVDLAGYVLGLSTTDTGEDGHDGVVLELEV